MGKGDFDCFLLDNWLFCDIECIFLCCGVRVCWFSWYVLIFCIVLFIVIGGLLMSFCLVNCRIVCFWSICFGIFVFRVCCVIFIIWFFYCFKFFLDFLVMVLNFIWEVVWSVFFLNCCLKCKVNFLKFIFFFCEERIWKYFNVEFLIDIFRVNKLLLFVYL